MKKMVIGVTGSFGSGKTFVASVFKSLGAHAIDADGIAKGLLDKGTGQYKRTVDAFGASILNSKGAIDRKKLAKIVFNDKRSLSRLNGILHPAVIGAINKEVGRSGKSVIIVDAPLLIEAKALRLVDKLVVVASSRKKQIERCVKKFGISKADVLKRIGSQMPLKKKARMADYVIDNDGTREDTVKQVKKIWRLLWR